MDAIDDDRAAAATPHRRDREPRRANGREQRLIERLLPVGVGRVGDRAAASKTDVVHQDVHAAERVDRARDHLGHAGFSGQVRGHRQHAIVAARQRPKLAAASDSRPSPRAHMADPAAFRHERGRAGQPEPTARTGHDGDLVR